MSLVSDSTRQVTVADGRATSVAIAAALRRAARKSRLPASFISGGGGFRARKGDRWFWRGIIASFVLLFALPLIGASAYFSFIASKQYETETKFSLRTGEPSVLDSLSGMAGLSGSQQNLDSQVIVNFIHSRTIIEKIDKALDLRRVYSRADVDWLSRFNPDKKIEDLEKYWRQRVDVSIDNQSSIISLSVRAFTPEDSLAITKLVTQYSEELVNNLTARTREDALKNAKDELTRSENGLVEATRAMRDVRNAEGVIDANATSVATGRVVGALQLKLAQLIGEYAVSSRSMGPQTPQMKILNVQIENMKSQISQMQNQLAGGNSGTDRTLADRMGNLSRQQVEFNLAEKRYATAAVQFEDARLDIETQHAYLANFLPPTLAQKALYPKRLFGWSLIVFPSLLLWSILAGLSVLVRDHMAA